MRDLFCIFLGYVVQTKYQKMSHALKTLVLVKIEILDNWQF
jgi:hypothetical protein